MMIIVMFVIFAIIIIVALSIMNVRFASKNAERNKAAKTKEQIESAAELQAAPPVQSGTIAQPPREEKAQTADRPGTVEKAESGAADRFEPVRDVAHPVTKKEVQSKFPTREEARTGKPAAPKEEEGILGHPSSVKGMGPAAQPEQGEAGVKTSPEMRSEKYAGKTTMENINDQAYRQALLKFKNSKNQEDQEPKKRNMNDDAFRRALISMTKKEEDHS
jgi:predicted Holliday junction resolvase-like endonuclease